MPDYLSQTSAQAIAMIIYFVAMIMIGLFAYMRTSNLDDFMLGDRQLSPAVAALSAGASDMSGWLLMGLPGAIYLNGLVEAWIAVGLTIGAWINWKVIAPRLRAYTKTSNNSITIPTFFGSRLRDNSNSIRLLSGIVILVFFTFYVSSGMVAGGKFFAASFGMPYHVGLVLVAGIVVLYTLVGGFLAVSWTDVVQGVMMVIALVIVPLAGVIYLGGFSGFTSGVTAVDPQLFHMVKGVSFMGVISALAWGLGYFGQPHILVRFMALRSVAEAKMARRIGIGWMLLAVAGATMTALVGVVVYHHDPKLLADPEGVFIALGQFLFHPIVAGFMLAAILAAIMSTISSQLLVTSSALVEDIYRLFNKKKIADNVGVLLGRCAVLGVSVVAAILAWPGNESILALVAFAWAGFGASFGPIVILSTYWRKLTVSGALAGMAVGAVTVVVWKYQAGGIFDIYEILPGFIFNLLVATGVSLVTYKPNPEIDAEFDEVVAETRNA